MEVLGYLSFVLMGLSLGLLGAGGAILTVPILVYLFGVDPKLATIDSLFIVGVTALIGAINYKANRSIDVRIALLFALPGLLGVVLAKSIFLPALPDPIVTMESFVFTKSIFIMIVFSILMFVASFSMIRKVASTKESSSSKSLILKFGLQGIAVGFVTGFVGAGGGFLIIPALVGFVGLSMRLAVGTSLMIITINSIVAFIISMKSDYHPNWNMLLPVLLIALIGFFVGANFSKKMSEKNLKNVFALFLIFIAVTILIDQIKTSGL